MCDKVTLVLLAVLCTTNIVWGRTLDFSTVTMNHDCESAASRVSGCAQIVSSLLHGHELQCKHVFACVSVFVFSALFPYVASTQVPHP